MTIPDWVWIAVLILGGHVITGWMDHGPCRHRWVRSIGHNGNRQRCPRCNLERMISEETE